MHSLFHVLLLKAFPLKLMGVFVSLIIYVVTSNTDAKSHYKKQTGSHTGLERVTFLVTRVESLGYVDSCPVFWTRVTWAIFGK